MDEIKIKNNKLNLKIFVYEFPFINNMDKDSFLRLCVDIEGKAKKFVDRRRNPKNRICE